MYVLFFVTKWFMLTIDLQFNVQKYLQFYDHNRVTDLRSQKSYSFMVKMITKWFAVLWSQSDSYRFMITKCFMYTWLWNSKMSNSNKIINFLCMYNHSLQFYKNKMIFQFLSFHDHEVWFLEMSIRYYNPR
jgi:hypothetical protein